MAIRKSRTSNLELHNHLYPVIMAGGSGTRFWPLSRQLFPKQLLRIMGDETLIQQTMRRVVCASAPNRVMISTNPAQAESIRVQLSEWKDALSDNFVLEPEGRNTAPAIALVALELVRRDPDAMMLVVPADHIVKGQRAFDAAVALAAAGEAGLSGDVWHQADPSRDRLRVHQAQPERDVGKTGAPQGASGQPIR